MHSFTVTFPDKTTRVFTEPVTGADLIPYFNTEPGPIVAIYVNNQLFSLTRSIDVQAEVLPVTTAVTEGSYVYRRTLCFVLAAAARELYPDLRLLIGHSLGYGYYYTLESSGNNISIDLADLERKMRAIIAADMMIETRYVSYGEAMDLFENSNQPDTYRLLCQTSKPKILINTLDGYSDLYFEPLLDKTGKLEVFELRAYGEGFLLRFPPTSHPDRLTDFEDIPQLFSVYAQSKKWGNLIGTSSVGQLNERVGTRKAKDYIEITETYQNKKIAEIADKIAEHSDVKVALIAGPSSSGKTTTSKKLSMQLRVLGYEPAIISIDDFYLGKDKTPLDEDGQPDYECLEALDVPLLNEILISLFNGEEVIMPSFDFKTGSRKFSDKKFRMDDRTILILEGIHAINDKLTPLVPREKKYKIYLSALTTLNLDDHNRIPTSDNRLIRRIVRDAQFRGKGAAGTISMWPSVQRGERLHIFPFQDKADIMFNSALDYELSVLKVYAEPLLRAVKPTQQEYSEATRLLTLLNHFMPIPSSYVPGQSIIREFIGESEFKY
ncbi:nucleoside kinase [Brucepastera parasyntrophica]|uniref:nucleoside kinase n=1 Tax=Brucepastera parasyntrophica TaxID=2880008 RepID=UPI00210B64CC|nr:nucleoside kinase [Brucepastera parasyntrophica]ULQ60153.1 nucleoside kinase [Brucepastera parasyntrophica]